LINLEYKYYRFGSEDSIDLDLLIEHPDSTGRESDTGLILKITEKHSNLSNANINIIKIEDHTVIHSIPSKGSPDAVHNSLFYTYHFHHQKFDLPIKVPIKRNLLLAIVRCVRVILTSFKKAKKNKLYRETIRPILRNDSFSNWLKICLKLDFELFNTLSMGEIDLKKKLVFHICQTISLINGIEIYTKKDLINHHPDVEDIINRIASTTSSQKIYEKTNLLLKQIENLEIKELTNNILELNTFKVNYREEK
jgi:hypothetical protein